MPGSGMGGRPPGRMNPAAAAAACCGSRPGRPGGRPGGSGRPTLDSPARPLDGSGASEAAPPPDSTPDADWLPCSRPVPLLLDAPAPPVPLA